MWEELQSNSTVPAELILNLEVLFMLSLFFITFMSGHLVRKCGSPVPESGVTVLIGLGFGFALKYGKEFFAKQGFEFDDWVNNFNPSFFFMLLLPVIIFESGFTIHKNAGSILAFAIFGTLFCALSTGFSLWGIADYGLGIKDLNMTEYLQFGALISSTDPVATLAVFGQLGANKLLESLCFGESVLNDAVAITLVKTLEKFQGRDTVSAIDVFAGIGWFLLTSVGSTFIGVIISVLLSALLRWTNIRHHPPVEVIFLILFAYLSYMTADAASLSGVVAIFFYGITSRHYTWYSLSKAARTSSLTMLVALKELAEQAVFCFLGIAIPTLFEYYNWALIGMAILTTFATRAIMVVGIAFLLNLKRKKSRITGKMQFVLWLAGLRGAVSYALALHIHPKNEFMITTTHSVILFTIFLLGATTGPVLKAFNLVEKETEEPPKKREDVDKWWHRFDRTYIIPYISYPRNVHTRKEERAPLSELHTDDLQHQSHRFAQFIHMENDSDEDPPSLQPTEDATSSLLLADDLISSSGSAQSSSSSSSDEEGSRGLSNLVNQLNVDLSVSVPNDQHVQNPLHQSGSPIHHRSSGQY